MSSSMTGRPSTGPIARKRGGREARDGHLVGGEAVRADAEEGERRLLPVDRRLPSPRIVAAMALEIGPEPRGPLLEARVSSPIRGWVTITARRGRSRCGLPRSAPLSSG